jgi:hypothetical protein
MAYTEDEAGCMACGQVWELNLTKGWTVVDSGKRIVGTTPVIVTGLDRRRVDD